MENYERIKEIALNDVDVLKEKGATYGESWKKRGGIGAFMMLARKWDRIENICTSVNYDILAAGGVDMGGILDDIQDLRRYLLLVESEVLSRFAAAASVPPQVMFTPPAPPPFPPFTTGGSK